MFIDWINNSLTQSLILSPVMGVLFGALFSGLTKSPELNSPRTIIKTREVYRERVIYRNSRSRSSSKDDRGIIGLAAFGLMMTVWQYAIWAVEIQHYIEYSILSVLSFSITTALISIYKGHFTSQEWWFYVIFPMVFLFFAMYLLSEASNRFDPSLTTLAKDTNWIQFYLHSLTGYGRSFMISHVIGIVTLAGLILTTTIILIHYLSLMNQRTSSSVQVFWTFLVGVTGIFSGRKGIVISSVLAIISFLLINEHVARWTTASA
jgi:hypothetical protein